MVTKMVVVSSSSISLVVLVQLPFPFRYDIMCLLVATVCAGATPDLIEGSAAAVPNAQRAAVGGARAWRWE